MTFKEQDRNLNVVIEVNEQLDSYQMLLVIYVSLY